MNKADTKKSILFIFIVLIVLLLIRIQQKEYLFKTLKMLVLSMSLFYDLLLPIYHIAAVVGIKEWNDFHTLLGLETQVERCFIAIRIVFL